LLVVVLVAVVVEVEELEVWLFNQHLVVVPELLI
jgi:hypothetical protein